MSFKIHTAGTLSLQLAKHSFTFHLHTKQQQAPPHHTQTLTKEQDDESLRTAAVAQSRKGECMHNTLQQLFHCTENLPQNIELQCWVFKDGDIPSVKGKVSRCVLGCNSSLASKSNHKHNYVCTLYCWYVFTKGHSRSEMYLVTAPRRYRLHVTTSLEFSRRNCMNSAYILIISYDPPTLPSSRVKTSSNSFNLSK